MPRLDGALTGTVWVVESGDYEQRAVYLVAESVEAAIAALKAMFAAPYKVRWESPTTWPPKPSLPANWNLTGHFERTRCSPEHTAHFDITGYELVTLAKADRDKQPVPDEGALGAERL